MIEDRADLAFALKINEMLRIDRMNVVPTINSPKPFTWSYSALKEYEICPLRYYECRVTKAWGQEKTAELERGDNLHLAMKHRVLKGTPLPLEFAYMEDWAAKLTAADEARYCEMKLAATIDMKQAPYFGRGVWLRGIVDYMAVSDLSNNMLIANIVDYKTGKPKDDDTQLELNACLTFAHEPKLVGVTATFLWTEYGDTSHTTVLKGHAKGIWDGIKPRVDKLQQAVIAGEFPAVKNRLCREWCPVLSCEHNGKR